MNVQALDFTAGAQRDGEWLDADGVRYRFMDRSTGTGWHRWDYEGDGRMAWLWHGVMVYGGPFNRVPITDELGEDADWDESWTIEC